MRIIPALLCLRANFSARVDYGGGGPAESFNRIEIFMEEFLNVREFNKNRGESAWRIGRNLGTAQTLSRMDGPQLLDI